jgi:hypothetical protein
METSRSVPPAGAFLRLERGDSRSRSLTTRFEVQEDDMTLLMLCALSSLVWRTAKTLIVRDRERLLTCVG